MSSLAVDVWTDLFQYWCCIARFNFLGICNIEEHKVHVDGDRRRDLKNKLIEKSKAMMNKLFRIVRSIRGLVIHISLNTYYPCIKFIQIQLPKAKDLKNQVVYFISLIAKDQ